MSVEEEWRPITVEGFEDRYDVSNFGRVRGWVRNYPGGIMRRKEAYILKGGPDKYGHLYVNLHNLEYPRTRPLRRAIHFLVCSAFHGPRPPGYDTRHLDGNKLNNQADNLAWGTRAENISDAQRHGTMPKKRSA